MRVHDNDQKEMCKATLIMDQPNTQTARATEKEREREGEQEGRLATKYK